VGIVQGYVTQSVLLQDFDREGYLEAVERFVSLPATTPE
jgi:hypothetical protein